MVTQELVQWIEQLYFVNVIVFIILVAIIVKSVVHYSINDHIVRQPNEISQFVKVREEKREEKKREKTIN